MYRSPILFTLALFPVLQNLLKVEFFVFACTDDLECGHNSSYAAICCSGVCERWWKCPGGCISDDTCSGGKVCFRNRCVDGDIEVPAYCSVDRDCLEGEECESGQCKPAPRPVTNDEPKELHVSFHFDAGVVIIIGAIVGGLIFLMAVSYGLYRCVKRYRRRRFSRGSYSQPSRYAISFSPSRNEAAALALYRQQIRERAAIPGRTTYSYPQTPPPEYDSLTLDSNLEVDSSSPPPYDQEQVGDTASRTSEEQV